MSEYSMGDLERFLDSLHEKSRTNLLPSLLKAQELFQCIPEEASLLISNKLKVPPVQVYGLLDFYSLLHKEPQPDTVIQVCTSPLCSQNGAEKILKALEKKKDPERLKVEAVHCLGLCTNPPSALVNMKQVCHLKEDKIDDLINGKGASPVNSAYSSDPVLTKRFGKNDPLSLLDYEKTEGFTGLKRALEMDKKDIIERVKSSGLLGRGGAAFPTGLKEESTAGGHEGETYVICNADESEPGTFKDRVLLHRDPYSVLEGMIITAYAVGSSRGFIYIRGEYKEAQEIFSQVIESAEKKGYLGDKIMGRDFQFSVEIRSGAGAYICGEETALFESIEGKKGYPRNKPPYPVDQGLFGQPTDINNVETFSYVSHILQKEKSSSGTRLFCLSGDVKRPGLYELPFGIRLSDLINEWGGGLRKDREIGAVILGGASGSFVPPDLMDIPLDAKSLKEAGLSMGSGVIMVFDDSHRKISLLRDITSFFNHESCGKCYPCRLGTRLQHQIISRFHEGVVYDDDLDKLRDIGLTMKESSLCGLGQTAASAVLSAISLYREELL